jgi:signal peptidase
MPHQPAHSHPSARARTVAQVLLLLVALGALAAAAYQTGTGRWHATPVLSGSMRPGLQPGDVVLTKRVPVSDLHVRDVIVFRPPGDAGRLKVHRIVDMTSRNGALAITTRGDANNVDDPEQASLSGHDTYRVERVVPLVGYPAVWLSGRNHGPMVIVLGLFLLVAALVTAVRKGPTPTGPAGAEDSGAEDSGALGDHERPRFRHSNGRTRQPADARASLKRPR